MFEKEYLHFIYGSYLMLLTHTAQKELIIAVLHVLILYLFILWVL